MPSCWAIASASYAAGASPPASTHVPERFVPAHVRVLFQQHDLRARDDRPPALVGLDQAGEAFEEGRLAGAVAADQREPVPGTDEHVELAQ